MKAMANSPRPGILKEQFIPDNVFIYIVRGGLRYFDGNKTDTLKAGEYGIARKNHLAKFELLATDEEFLPYVFCFDEPFLQSFLDKHRVTITEHQSPDALFKLRPAPLVDEFILSLKPYYKGFMQLDEAFEGLKYEELLLILLRSNPELSGLLFNFSIPQKINLEGFMNRNFKFNISLERFAFLTGRSISAFKRDFKAIYNETPGRWLTKRRLEEAYFLIRKQQQKPSDIYLDLGFESLSHFSYAFKKEFGVVPTSLTVH
ncbi:transcriptional regulator [Chitinophaga sp. YR627]|uniref:helix-turn-helix transcriptional regulator n=1 Tax=Chitinophaga sp. YR627 TaxID=1881041 RepID=UPI0008DF8311|nr:AraC family transcriptional regulator [Chitinophaga sp. YR627]SFM63421.1 transcriptional regulator [Chitinophaga sp. YR627]